MRAMLAPVKTGKTSQQKFDQCGNAAVGRRCAESGTSYLEKYARETFSTHAGQRSPAIIPGDDPGGQKPPERRGCPQDLFPAAP
jgi:hypothetical protein